jgi:hypothetical protein
LRKLLLILLLSGSTLMAQDNKPSNASQEKPKAPKGQVIVQGCVGISSGDYVLVKQDPAFTYVLQAAGKMKLGQYLGQLVEATGKEVPTLSSSSDVLTRSGSPSADTLVITSIKTIRKQCPVQQIREQ